MKIFIAGIVGAMIGCILTIIFLIIIASGKGE